MPTCCCVAAAWSTCSPTRSWTDAILPHGVTSIVCDPHEVANVLGAAGVRDMLDANEGLGLSVLVMAPSCMPVSSIETSGAALGVEDLVALADHPRVIGLAEVMNFPGVLAASDDVLDKLRAFAARPLDGHVPGLTGPDLQAYVGTGISSDHESVTAEEAREWSPPTMMTACSRRAPSPTWAGASPSSTAAR